MTLNDIIKTFDYVSIEMEIYGAKQEFKDYRIQLIPANKEINFLIEYTDEIPNRCIIRIVQMEEIMVNAFMGIKKEPHAVLLKDTRHVELIFDWICEHIEKAKTNYGGDGYHRAWLGLHANTQFITVDELPIF